MLKKILSIMAAVMLFVVAAGIYRFNFTNDDIYVANDENNTNVMLTLFSFDTDDYWQIQLPDSKAKAPLTDLREYSGLYLATGKYQDGDEYGTVSLDYYKITPLNLGNVEDEMIFSAPFSVSNQGSGTFWYLGLFNLNTDSGEIGQIDTFFLGDRIKLDELKVDEPFDVTSSLYVSYFKHAQKQSMAEIPNEKVDQYIKVSIEGLQGKP
jgi:hypothetical protein